MLKKHVVPGVLHPELVVPEEIPDNFWQRVLKDRAAAVLRRAVLERNKPEKLISFCILDTPNEVEAAQFFSFEWSTEQTTIKKHLDEMKQAFPTEIQTMSKTSLKINQS
jgi:hypothetical protein